MEDKIVIGIVKKGSKVLLINRQEKEGNLIWAFPGGKIESGENEQEALKREILEETNIRCQPTQKIGERVHPDTQKQLIYWLCKYDKGKINISKMEEIIETRWMSSEDVFKHITSDLFEPVKFYLVRLAAF